MGKKAVVQQVAQTRGKGGSGDKVPQKSFKFRVSEMTFPTFSTGHSQ